MLSIDQGLPNIGNTCFLNSVIQSLYPIDSFRERIENYEFHVEQNAYQSKKMIFLFKKLFMAIQNQKNKSQKTKILEGLLEYLQNLNINYTGRTQQDSCQFLCIILDRLFLQDEQLKKFFKIYYKLPCLTCGNSIKTTQFIKCNFQVKCSNSQCRQTIRTVLISSPNAIIYTGKPLKNQQIRLKDVNNQQKLFTLASQILYSGNGMSGHYVCRRRLRQKTTLFKIFNDESVQDSQNKSRYQTKIQIYKFQPSNIQEPFIQVDANKLEIQGMPSLEKQNQFDSKQITFIKQLLFKDEQKWKQESKLFQETQQQSRDSTEIDKKLPQRQQGQQILLEKTKKTDSLNIQTLKSEQQKSTDSRIQEDDKKIQFINSEAVSISSNSQICPDNTYQSNNQDDNIQNANIMLKSYLSKGFNKIMFQNYGIDFLMHALLFA